MLNIRNQENVIWLCSTPLENDNANQLTFPDKVAQSNYFISKQVKRYENVTYTRKPVDGEMKKYIRLESPIWELSNCNYAVIKNRQSNNYIYAFITRLEYISEKTTYVHLESDAFQTWQFDIEYKKSFIDRQTPITDYPNTLHDNVAVGQQVIGAKSKSKLNGAYFVFCSSPIHSENIDDVRPFALKIGNYSIPCFTLYWSQFEGEEMAKVLQRVSDAGIGDRILSAVFIPFVGLDMVNPTVVDSKFGTMYVVEEIPEAILKVDRTFTFPVSEPKKLFTYPYSKILVRDYATGQTIELAPEKFKTLGTCEFEIRGNISETPSYKIIPKNYEGHELAYNHALVVKCNTSLPVANNLYAKYLLQNSESNMLSKIGAISGGAVGVGTSLATGNLVGVAQGTFNTFMSVANITAQENKASLLGNSVTSISDDALYRLAFEDGYDICLMTMDSDHTEMAKNYWKMLGYPVKSLATPNIKGNAKYNYVKLATPNIIGDNIPNDELQKIKQMFLNGVTLWHDPNSFLNY